MPLLAWITNAGPSNATAWPYNAAPTSRGSLGIDSGKLPRPLGSDGTANNMSGGTSASNATSPATAKLVPRSDNRAKNQLFGGPPANVRPGVVPSFGSPFKPSTMR
jgi:hypothetical protein